ncbi:MAG: hypothetical protein R6U19_06405 [Bacteroidales bacterium]
MSISPGIRSGSPAPLNQILYGPPGTGKTYKTISKALEILGEANLEKMPREEIKKRFEEKVRGGRIVFTSFHQSMAYEDFVEGIKRVSDDEEGWTGDVHYKILKGDRDEFYADAGGDVQIYSGENTMLNGNSINENARYKWYSSNDSLLSESNSLSVAPQTSGQYIYEILAESDGFKPGRAAY